MFSIPGRKRSSIQGKANTLNKSLGSSHPSPGGDILLELKIGVTGVTSDGWGPDDAPVAEPLRGREVEVGDSRVGLGCIENRGAQVGGGGVVHMSEGVGVFSLQHGSSATCAPGVSDVVVFVNGFG